MNGGHEDLKFASTPTDAGDPVLIAQQRHRAARAVASAATDARECAELLDMLGLTAEEGRTATPHRAA